MAPSITPVQCADTLPRSTTVVIIGGGIVGLTAALCLSERGVPVTVLEKGRLAAEQSSRNLGWVRKMGRSVPDIPLSLAADKLWAGMPGRVGADVGYRQAGIMYLAKNDAEMAGHEKWLASVKELSLGSQLLAQSDIERLVPGGRGQWAGGLYTATDGRAEPTLASSAIAQAAIDKGAIILEHCAVRSVIMSTGRVAGVMTERGEITCDQALLAGGLWSRRFLGNLGVDLPTLPLVASVLRTGPMQGPTEIAVGGPDFSFRKRLDGGYTITQRGALVAPLLLDHLLIGRRYLPSLRQQLAILRLSLGRDFVKDFALKRHWKPTSISPFERVRVMDPSPKESINAEALENLRRAWPAFEGVSVHESWAGMMDITPDSIPVISKVPEIRGLTVASGFSGHGFGTAPAAGQLAADLVTDSEPLVDPSPYRLDRF